MIKIIHEAVESDPDFLLARKRIKEAHTVCFLGFGYDQVNLSRLGLSQATENRVVYTGTIYGLEELELTRARNAISQAAKNGPFQITLKNHWTSWDVLAFLRRRPVLGC